MSAVDKLSAGGRAQVRFLQQKAEQLGIKTDPEDLAVELVKLDMERDTKAAKEKADREAAKAEKARIHDEADAMKAAQSAAAAEAYSWMKVFAALSDRGMEPNKIMDSIKAMQDNGHSAEMCLEMIEKTEVKAPVRPKAEPKPPPRPESFGSWA
ncbi:hypothetical protein S21ZY_105 [Pseudomonas phage ZY21]|nr:hypothetical protein S21ZY_105 [Pseudomonas phage ZY21]